ncbi:MAG: DUF1549 domain-containing protein [Verrucomicrobiales bacterium]
MGNTNLEEQNKRQLEMDVIDEQLDALGKAFLGQALGCARCHDHKFDPIPMRDYHAMAGIFKNHKQLEHANVSKWMEIPLPLAPDEEARFVAHEKQLAALEAELKVSESGGRRGGGRMRSTLGLHSRRRTRSRGAGDGISRAGGNRGAR